MMLPFLILSVIIIGSLLGGIGGLLWFRQRNKILALTHYDNGVSYLQTGEYPKALDEFSTAIKRQSNLVSARYGLGLTYLKQQQYQEGIEILESVVKEMPHNAIAHYNLGRTYITVGKLDQARWALETALKINPEIKEIHFNLARLFQEQGDLEQAKNSCNNALKLDSGYTKAQEYLNLLSGNYTGKPIDPEVIRRALKDFDHNDAEFMIRL